MEITRRDIGYAIYSRLEESLRRLVHNGLLTLFGRDWKEHIPAGIRDKVSDKLSLSSIDDVDDPMTILEETDLPDLMEIMCFKHTQDCFHDFFPDRTISRERFQEIMAKLYPIRVKIAHVKQAFSAFDLDLLTEIANTLLPGAHQVFR